jgi:hypothetical protein
MITRKKGSFLIGSGVFVLTAGCIETLRWFGYLGTITPITRTAFAALIASSAFCLIYYLSAAHNEDKLGK